MVLWLFLHLPLDHLLCFACVSVRVRSFLIESLIWRLELNTLEVLRIRPVLDGLRYFDWSLVRLDPIAFLLWASCGVVKREFDVAVKLLDLRVPPGVRCLLVRISVAHLRDWLEQFVWMVIRSVGEPLFRLSRQHFLFYCFVVWILLNLQGSLCIFSQSSTGILR